jgi:general transcription factor 3C polypeptide 3 (transcription factor C subunit 4)
MLVPEDDGPDSLANDYPDLFRDTADALHGRELHWEALRFYETLHKVLPNYMTLRNFIGMYTSYQRLERTAEADKILQILQDWNADTVEDLVILAMFFEDNGMEAEAWARAEATWKHGGIRLLKKAGFRRYEDLLEWSYRQLKATRGKHSHRKTRLIKYRQTLRAATRADDDPMEENEGDAPDIGSLSDRPEPGLFRTKKSIATARPQNFLPDEISGTNIPNDALDQNLFREKLNVLAEEFPEELQASRAQHREIVASFKRLQELYKDAEHGDDESISQWMSIARELIEEFSTFDLFYIDRRHAFTGYFRRMTSGDIWKEAALMVLAVAANNVEDGETEPEIKERYEEPPEEFYGVHFDEWLDTFASYSLFLAQEGEEDRCFSTIEIALQSKIFFNSQKYAHQLQMCRLACALSLDASTQASVAMRWFLKTHPFGNELFRLYSCVNRLCSVPSGFATPPALKLFQRWAKTMDYALLTPEQRGRFNFRTGREQGNWLAKAVSVDILKYVKDHDPTFFALHGHALMCGGGAYQAALNYYFRAYTLCPDDAVLNLSIGMAYVQHAMKRLSENRQFQIQQGLAFVYRYYELRTKDGVAAYCSEAEFNVGRVWHTLGLTTQAVLAYERCIEFSRKMKRDGAQGKGDVEAGGEDFAAEAAFCIQTIYALSGNMEGARKVTEEVLVIE